MTTFRMNMILRNPRVVIPPSKRIHNWKSLPVEGVRAMRRNRRRSAVLRAASIFVATALRAAVAIARKCS